MITIFAERNGETEQATKFDRAWLNPASGVHVWVDLAAPSIPESLILSDTFNFHPLSVEDAMSERQYPKAEAYDGYLYVILHGIHYKPGETLRHPRRRLLRRAELPGDRARRRLRARSPSCEIMRPATRRSCRRAGLALHRIVDAMVDHYRPEMDKLEDRIDELEKEMFAQPDPTLVRRILDEKRDVAVAAAHRHAAARRRSPGWRAAISSTSARRCRSVSATYTTISSALPTMC